MIKENKIKAIISSALILLPALITLIFQEQLSNIIRENFLGESSLGLFFMTLFLPCLLESLHWVMLLITEADYRKNPQHKKLVGIIFFIVPVISLFVECLFFAIILGWQISLQLLCSLTIGIAMMIVSIVCAVDSSNKGSGMSFRWLILCMGAFLTNGLVGLMQKIHQSSDFKAELSTFLIIAFLFSAVYSLVFAFIGCKKGQKITVTQSGRVRKLILFSVICGAGIAFCNHINMYLAGVMAAIVFYPVVNGASMLLNTIAGVAL